MPQVEVKRVSLKRSHRPSAEAIPLRKVIVSSSSRFSGPLNLNWRHFPLSLSLSTFFLSFFPSLSAALLSHIYLSRSFSILLPAARWRRRKKQSAWCTKRSTKTLMIQIISHTSSQLQFKQQQRTRLLLEININYLLFYSVCPPAAAAATDADAACMRFMSDSLSVTLERPPDGATRCARS